MSRTFLLQLFFLIFINLLIKPFYAFGIDLQVQNRVEQEVYGLYFVLFNFSFLLQIFSDWGLQQYNNRQVAQYTGWFRRFFPHLLAWKILLSLAMLLIGAVGGWILGYWESSGWGLAGMLLNQVLLTFILFIRSSVSGLQHYFLDSILSVLDKLILIIICLIGLYTDLLGEFTIYTFIFSQTFSLCITCLGAALVLMYCAKGQKLQWRIRLDWAVLKRTTPYAMVVLLMLIYSRIDGILIEQLLPDGAAQAGLYAFGYRMLDMVCIFCFLFTNLLLPMFARLLTQQKELDNLLELGFRWMFALTVTASALIFFYAEPICRWLYEDYNPDSVAILQVLMISFNPLGFVHIFGTLLTAGGRLWAMNQVFVGAIILNILLNLWLIPIHGALGAAYTVLVTQIFVALGEVYLVYRWRNAILGAGFWLHAMLFAAGALAAAWASTHVILLDWRIVFVATAAFIGVWALLVRWVDLRILGQLKTKI